MTWAAALRAAKACPPAWGGHVSIAAFRERERFRALAPDLRRLKSLGVPAEGWIAGNFRLLCPRGARVSTYEAGFSARAAAR